MRRSERRLAIRNRRAFVEMWFRHRSLVFASMVTARLSEHPNPDFIGPKDSRPDASDFGPFLKLQNIDESPEHRLHGIPIQQTKQQSATGANDLTRDSNHRVHERTELHLQ